MFYNRNRTGYKIEGDVGYVLRRLKHFHAIIIRNTKYLQI